MCIQKHTCVCPQQQLVGQPLTLGRNPHFTYSATHMCVCAHSSSWSAKVVECSKPSSDFFIDLFCNTHMCVCAHSSKLLANHQLTSSATHMCVCAHSSNWSAKVFLMLKSSKHFFWNHTCVCAHSSNCRDPHFMYSETHMCMPTAAIGRLQGWNPHLTFSATHMCVCSQQHLVCQKC